MDSRWSRGSQVESKATGRRPWRDAGLISQWEAGKTKPPLASLVLLSQVFDRPLTGLVGHGMAYPGELVEDERELTLLYVFRKVPPETRDFFIAMCRGAITTGNVVALPTPGIPKAS